MFKFLKVQNEKRKEELLNEVDLYLMISKRTKSELDETKSSIIKALKKDDYSKAKRLWKKAEILLEDIDYYSGKGLKLIKKVERLEK